MGDFNAVIDPSEVSSHHEINIDQGTADFSCLLEDAKMIDHPVSGCFFTWSNRRDTDLQLRKLDRILLNESWFHKPIFSKAHFAKLGISDHSPSILQLTNMENSGPKPFNYFNFWSSNENFLPVLHKVWSCSSPGSQWLHCSIN